MTWRSSGVSHSLDAVSNLDNLVQWLKMVEGWLKMVEGELLQAVLKASRMHNHG